MSKNKHRGLHAHRLKGNPEEKLFATAWARENELGHLLDHLLDERFQGRPVEATEREAQVAATVIQWLGSPVGQNFLANLGYSRNTRMK